MPGRGARQRGPGAGAHAGPGCIREAFFLSTCNRVEAVCITEPAGEAEAALVRLMSELGRSRSPSSTPRLYAYRDAEAVAHVFRVASSLDSMVVGEPQILGQIKEAYLEATRRKTSGVILNRLMHRAFHVAKRVRSETGISDAAVSISYAAIELARKIFHALQDKQVLLIGAGEMAELAARHLKGQGVERSVVANRSLERAVQVAEDFRGRPVSFEEIEAELVEADIVISSTASPGYVITPGAGQALPAQEAQPAPVPDRHRRAPGRPTGGEPARERVHPRHRRPQGRGGDQPGPAPAGSGQGRADRAGRGGEVREVAQDPGGGADHRVA